MNYLRNLLKEQELEFEITPEAKAFLAQRGYEPAFGARPLKRFIQHTIETMIAKTLLKEDVKPNSTLVIDANGDELEIKIKR